MTVPAAIGAGERDGATRLGFHLAAAGGLAYAHHRPMTKGQVFMAGWGALMSNALGWAHANAMHPHVAAWLHACSQWDSAVATKEHERRDKRRKLCKEHDIPCTKVVDTNKELETAMEYIRRQLTNRIKDIRAQPLLQSKAPAPPSVHPMQQRAVSADTTRQPPPKKTEHRRDNKLDNYFTPRAAGDACPETEELRIPDVATDVNLSLIHISEPTRLRRIAFGVLCV